jgi:hypothetical protein
MTDADGCEEGNAPAYPAADLRDNPRLKAAFALLATNDKFMVDPSVIQEVVFLSSVARSRKEQADRMRLPKRYKTTDDLHELTSFIVEVQGNRDRVMEIKIGHLGQRRALQLLWEKCVGFLYRFEEIRKCSPAEARAAMINYVLHPLRERITQVNDIIEAASEADRNLGNAYFSLRELKSIGMAFIEAKAKETGH